MPRSGGMIMTRFAIVSALALALAACGDQPANEATAEAGAGQNGGAEGKALALGADGVPQFRPGAWEIREVNADEGISEVRRECVGADANPQLREMLTRSYPAECKVERDSNSGRLYLKASCPQNGLTIDSEMELTGSDTEMDLKFGAYVVMPDGKREGGEATLNGRWVGECPAGAEPGEEIEG